ncbi:hydroxymethylbilane synthase [Halocatena pleomorpha]|uniref:Hydroxymethylbilane synthase n=1 Tax=Halocatena pleomorpha TaxID=1785090 RepID=A0A3P3RBF6_9EURY|nr:hydroxymethylbilane synthase [Halocatena pleomorpha]RRJ30725.1 hydroxymethylbilane synthase [Halocatena pleomorpha]
MSTRTVRLATRGSSLARRQANAVKSALETRRRSVELVEVETRGDQIRDELIHRLGQTGAFVRSLDEKVMAGELDGAVHSMKDMPTEVPEELVVAGLPERALPNDVLLTPNNRTLSELPSGAVVGTSSLRRTAQLLADRPDLTVTPLRGNVDTRVEKLLAPALQREHEHRLDADENENGGDDGDDAQEWFESLSPIERRALEREVDTEYDAIVLAEAGLQRSGIAHHIDYQQLSPVEFVPAPAQGVIAVTALEENAETIHDTLDHAQTRITSTVERSILAELGGGCVAPIGVYARLRGEYVNTVVRVLSRDGTEEIAETRDLPVENHPSAAREFAADLRECGAAQLIEQATEEPSPSPSRQE